MRATTSLALALATWLLAAPAASDPALSLEDAVRQALARNERARQATLRVDAAEGALERARAPFLPSLSAGGTLTGNATEDRAGRNWTTGASLTLSQSLVAPSAWPLYAQARESLSAERAGSVADLRELAYDAARAFVQALAADRVLAAADARLARARANFADAEARAAAELASVNDATRARLDVASAEQAVATQRGAVQRGRLALELLLGAPVPEALAAPTAAERTEALLAEGIERLGQGAAERRPEVREAHGRAEAALSSAREPSWRLAPVLGATGQIRETPAPLPGAPSTESLVTLSLTWPIFDGGARYGDLHQRRAQAESAVLAEALLRRSVAIDVRSTWASFVAARDAYRIADAAVATAAKNSEETTVLYRQGLATALELTDANGKLFDAESGRATARLSWEQAALDVRFALGVDPVEGVTVAPAGAGGSP